MNDKLPVETDSSIISKIKKIFRRLIDMLFTNRSEGKLIAEILEDGRVINYDSDGNPINDNKEELEVQVDMDSKEDGIDQNLSDEVNDRLSSFEESIKVDVSVQKANREIKEKNEAKELENKKLEFVQSLEENPASLIDLSMDRLKKIEEYYDELIADIENKLESSKKVS